MKILGNTAEWYFLMIKISIIGQSAFGESVAKEILKMNGTIISSILSDIFDLSASSLICWATLFSKLECD